MNIYAKIPAMADFYFEQIKEQFESAIMAGGCLRDLAMGRPVKDYDVFISKSDQGNHFVRKLSNSFKGSHYTVRSENWYYKIPGVYEVRKVQLHHKQSGTYMKFDLVFVDGKPIDFFHKEFDFGICKAYYNGERTIYTSDFIKDATNKTVTLMGPLRYESVRYSLSKHLPRFLHKYPEFRPVIPPEYDLEILKANMKKKPYRRITC